MTIGARGVDPGPKPRSLPARALLSAPVILALGVSAAGCGAGRFIGLGSDDVTEHRAAAPARAPESSLESHLAEYREQATLSPKEPYWPFRIARAWVDADSLAPAETELRASLERDPCYAPALSLLSKLYFDAGRHDEAIRMLEAARSGGSACPGKLPPELLTDLALHYDAIGRGDLAESVMNSLSSGERRAVGSAGVYLTLRGSDPAPATQLAEWAVYDQPHSAVTQNNYGITRLRAGDPGAARKAFEEAIKLDPKLPGPYYNLAILEKFYAFDDEAAANWFKQYREYASDDPDGLANLLEKSGPKELAQKRGDK